MADSSSDIPWQKACTKQLPIPLAEQDAEIVSTEVQQQRQVAPKLWSSSSPSSELSYFSNSENYGRRILFLCAITLLSTGLLWYWNCKDVKTIITEEELNVSLKHPFRQLAESSPTTFY
jgi:hypothetical protein